MHHLLDFLYEYCFDKQLYCALPADGGELQLTWRAAHPLTWEVRHASSGFSEQVPRASVLAYLTHRSADLILFESELRALVASHVVVADQLLAAAHAAFGSESVEAARRGQQELARELRRVVESHLSLRLRLVRGGAD